MTTYVLFPLQLFLSYISTTTILKLQFLYFLARAPHAAVLYCLHTATPPRDVGGWCGSPSRRPQALAAGGVRAAGVHPLQKEELRADRLPWVCV